MAQMEIRKRVANAILYTNGMIKVENVRASFPHLDRPFAGKRAKPTDVPKFGIVGMLSKQTHVEAKNLIVASVDEILQVNKITKLPSKDKFIRNGDDEKEPAYSGHWIVSCRETKRPSVRTKRGELVTEPERISDMVYGGCWVHILLRPWWQDNDWGQKVNAGLVGVQFIRDDEPFGEGRIDDTDAWGNEDDGGGPAGDRDDDTDDGL